MMRGILIMLIWLAVLFPAVSGDIRSGLSEGERTRVVEVIDGDTVVIDPPVRGMDEIRLVGLQAPKLPLGREGFKAWPMAGEARAALVDLVAGRPVQLFYGGRRADRHGRLLAHLWLDDDTWVQGEMISRGWARVYGFADNRALLWELLFLEEDARAREAGIWAHPNYQVRTPLESADLIGRFELVEGEVVDAAVVNRTLYINFGDNWRDDFTLRARPDVATMLLDAGIEVANLRGQRVRSRGWIKSFNGPMIDITHPEQVEIVR